MPEKLNKTYHTFTSFHYHFLIFVSLLFVMSPGTEKRGGLLGWSSDALIVLLLFIQILYDDNCYNPT